MMSEPMSGTFLILVFIYGALLKLVIIISPAFETGYLGQLLTCVYMHQIKWEGMRLTQNHLAKSP